MGPASNDHGHPLNLCLINQTNISGGECMIRKLRGISCNVTSFCKRDHFHMVLTLCVCVCVCVHVCACVCVCGINKLIHA